MINLTKISIFFLLLLSIFQTACAPLIITGPVATGDRRDFEAQYMDEKIEWIAITDTQEFEGNFRANFVSYNQKLLVTGQASNQELINKIISTVKKIKNVKKVYNKMTIGERNTYKNIANDTVITTNVISRVFAKEGKGRVTALSIKVYTESNIVYLLGLVTQKEADQAIKIARTSKGVKIVVPLFEITK